MAQKFCCERLKYFSIQTHLVDTLYITPRVIVCGRRLKLQSANQFIVHITNKSLYSRPLSFDSDSPSEIAFLMDQRFETRYLDSMETLILKIHFKPQSKQCLNRRRTIFIGSEHPCIKFEVPVVVTRDLVEPSYIDTVRFPSTVPGTDTHYEMVIYNPLKEDIMFSLKSQYSKMKIIAPHVNIKKNDYTLVLLSMHVIGKSVLSNELKIKFTSIPFRSLPFVHEPLTLLLVTNLSQIAFGQVKYERETKSELMICNESNVSLTYDLKIMTSHSEMIRKPRESIRLSALNLPRKEHDTIPNVGKPLINYIEPNDSYNSVINSSSDGSESIHERPAHYDEFRLINHKHFAISQEELHIDAKSRALLTITFKPTMDPECDFDEEFEAPFVVKTKLFITVHDEETTERKAVILSGLIMGPPFEISPRSIDYHSINLGEEHVREIKVRNVDGQVPASIRFLGYVGNEEADVQIRPEEGFVLESCQSNVFTLYVFSKSIGKFILRIRFKVKNGKVYTVVARGDSRPIQLTTFPAMLEFGNIPIAIPQRKSILVVNPISAPICIRLTSIDDGEDTPLVLNVERINDLPPINILDPVKLFDKELQERHAKEEPSLSDDEISINDTDEAIEEAECEEEEEVVDDEMMSITRLSTGERASAITYKSMVSDEISVYSTAFEDLILNKTPILANDLVNHIKKKRSYIDKTEPEKKVIAAGVHSLFMTGYFDQIRINQNFGLMDWGRLPSDPKEFYYDTEIIRLRPHYDKSISFILIPNKPGTYHRMLEIRICPISNLYERRESNVFVDSELMITKLWVEYTCVVPNIDWNNDITLEDEVIYAGQPYNFEMDFYNPDSVAGFLYFEFVPDDKNGVMTFTDLVWKFYIKPNQIATANCQVLFRSYGDNIRLPGLIRRVGNILGDQFCIHSKVLPTVIRLSVKEVKKQQSVLEDTEYYIYIDNITPTKTTIVFSLQSEKFQNIHPLGCILSPGQSTYITLRSKFYDPQLYHNELTVAMPYGKTTVVPLVFNVINMPIVFDPNIRCDLDIGNIIVNSEEGYIYGPPMYTKNVLVYNRGFRSYRLSIHKLKNSDTLCVTQKIKGRITISMDTEMVLMPGSVNLMRITADAYEETNVHNEFRITIVDSENRQRFVNIRFVIKAKFIQPEMHWNRREIVVTYKRSHKFKEHIILDLAELTNIAAVPVEDVVLKCFGPFRIKLLFEEHFTKELRFAMNALERRDVFIVLNKAGVRDEYCKKITGRIACSANGRFQRSLPLTVNIYSPQLILATTHLMLFKDNYESKTFIELANMGCMDAEYKWVKTGATQHYVESYDHADELAHDILSDIFRMLELSDVESDPPSDYVNEMNMSARYQRYRCHLRRIEDPIGVREILDWIIDNLDLEHKRYTLKVDDLDQVEMPEMESSERPSSAKEAATQTLDQILTLLNIEDSYEITPPSPEDCMMQFDVYFYIKSGVVPAGAHEKCLIHLPAVRKGHEVTTTFELQVVGSPPTQFTVVLVNLTKTITLSRESIYLGAKPWYESYKTAVTVRNITKYEINVRVAEAIEHTRRRCQRLHEGYVNIDCNQFSIEALGTHLFHCSGNLGFCDEFVRDITLIVNDSDEENLRLRGQGVMPILGMLSKLDRLTLDPARILMQYKLLQRIYYFDIFANIIEEDEDYVGNEENKVKELPVNENDSMYDFSTDMNESVRSHLSERTSAEVEEFDNDAYERRQRHERHFFRLMQTYVIVYNNEELPNAMVLEQLMETEMFTELVKSSPEACCLLNSVYQEYRKSLSTSDKKMPVNVKFFTVQPLPCEVHGFKFNLMGLRLNQFQRYEMSMQFFGPGKLIAAVRTTVAIPGLLVKFEVAESEDRKFSYYTSMEQHCELFCKPYRNLYEREMDAENDPTLKHAHSFDHTPKLSHKRSIPNRDRKNIFNYYNSLIKSVYVDRKHHHVISKIYTHWPTNFSGTNLKIVLLIKPESKFYEDGQVLEDYIYIDLHMGPTLPILLRGLVMR